MNSTIEIHIYIQIEMFLQDYRRDRSEQNYYTRYRSLPPILHCCIFKGNAFFIPFHHQVLMNI